jgi:hypothetical protein
MVVGEKAIADLQVTHVSIEHRDGSGCVFDEQPEQRFVGLYDVFEAPAVLVASK